MDIPKPLPIISFIVPVYNGEAYIGRCLDSLAKQGNYNFEVIVVNDGSTDSTMDLVRGYCTKDRRFRCLSQENSGYVHTMNKLITLAVGEYLYSVDADNWVPKNLVRNVYGLLCGGYPDFVQYSLTLCSQTGESVKEGMVGEQPKRLSNRSEIFDAMWRHDVYLASHGGKFIRRTLAAKFSFHGEPTGSDRRWIGQILAASSSGLLIPATGLFVEMRKESISRKAWGAVDHFCYSTEMLKDIDFYRAIGHDRDCLFFPQLGVCFEHYYSGIHALISKNIRNETVDTLVGKKIWKFRKYIFPPKLFKRSAFAIWLICKYPKTYILLCKMREKCTRKMAGST